MDTIEDRRDRNDECQHETFKKAKFSSKEFVIKNKFLQVMVWKMKLLTVYKIEFEREVDLSLDRCHS